MTEPTDIDALIAEARKITTHGVTDIDLVLRLADALESTAAELREAQEMRVSTQTRYRARLKRAWAELRQERERADEAFGAGLAQVAVRAERAEAKSDRLHKAITDVRAVNETSWRRADVRAILRAALDKEGNDNE